MNFTTYIKAVGTGPKSNREMSKDEIKDAIRQILNRSIPDELITAFLLGWRVRLESTIELKSTLEVFDEYIKRDTIPNSIELGYPFDGKADNPYLLPLIAKYLKKLDINLVVSFDDLQPAKKGLILKDLFKEIKAEDNIFCFDRKEYFKELSELTSLRNILGLRTAFNTVEKLLNPGNSSYGITAAFHKPYVKKYNELFSKNYKKFMVVKGSEGTPEIFSRAKYWLNINGEIEEFIIDPEYFGIKDEKSTNRISFEDSIKMAKNPSENLNKLAKLNAALFVVSTDKTNSLTEAFEMLG